VDFDAAWLANGCTPQAFYATGTVTAPPSLAPNVLYCPAGVTCVPSNPLGSTTDYIPPQVNP
jgi:hypothetical protein